MIDGMMVQILFHNGKAIGVEVPQVVELKIVETQPNFKGDTQGSNKTSHIREWCRSSDTVSRIRRRSYSR